MAPAALHPLAALVERFLAHGTETASREQALFIRRARGMGLVGLGVVAIAGVIPSLLDGTLAVTLACLGLMATMGLGLAFGGAAGGRFIRPVTHLAMGAILLGILGTAHQIGYANEISVTFTILLILVITYALGVRAAFGWTLVAIAGMAVSVFNSELPIVPPEAMQPTYSGLFGARTAVLLSAFAFAAVERRFADRQSRTLEYMARHDPLTGLLNRRAFEERLDEAIARGRRYRRRFAILAIDIDRFKPVNDAHGHAAGDELLRELADRIRAATRTTDAASRVGGDEFIVLLEEVLEDKNVALLARRMLASLMAPAEISGVSIDVGASIGIVTFPDAASEALPLVRAADLAMYRAKSAGGGSLHFHDSMDPAIRD